MKEISLCVISLNQEKYMFEFLKNIEKFVDEIIIVDTGSIDNTLKIIKKFKCKLFNIEQKEKGMAELRNFSLNKATKDWILVLDPDEKISERDFIKIRDLIENEEYEGYYLIQRQYTNEVGHTGWVSSKDDAYEESRFANGWFPNPILRLFKNDNRIRYQGIIHETVDNLLLQIGRARLTDIPIHHFGAFDMAKSGKADRNIELLKKGETGTQEQFFVYFHSATNFLAKKDNETALLYLKKTLELNPNFVPALLNLAGIYITDNNLTEAEKILITASQLEQNTGIYNNLGIIYAKRKEFNRAIKKFEKALQLNPNSADAYYNLSLVYREKGKKEKAEFFLEKAQELNPSYSKNE